MAENDPPQSCEATPGADSEKLLGLRQEDVVALLSRHTLNDYSRVQGLLHFCGGEEKSGNTPCHKIAKKFVEDIESRTKTYWDNLGKTELVKRYTLGVARVHVLGLIDRWGQDWEKIKVDFLKMYLSENFLGVGRSEKTDRREHSFIPYSN